MNITMEKKKAAPKGMKLPSKTYINLAQKESRKKDVIATVLGLILILIVAGCVAKFGVIDQLERLDRAVDSIREKYGEGALCRACFLHGDVAPMGGGLSKERRTGITKPV